ncbi:MAG: Flp family type IVb pilin [Actinomycetes bacterium]
MRIPAITRQSVTSYRDERGNAMVEYALIIFLISIVGLVGLSAVGGASLHLYDVIGDALAEIFG